MNKYLVSYSDLHVVRNKERRKHAICYGSRTILKFTKGKVQLFMQLMSL